MLITLSVDLVVAVAMNVKLTLMSALVTAAKKKKITSVQYLLQDLSCIHGARKSHVAITNSNPDRTISRMSTAKSFFFRESKAGIV